MCKGMKKKKNSTKLEEESKTMSPYVKKKEKNPFRMSVVMQMLCFFFHLSLTFKSIACVQVGPAKLQRAAVW